MIPSLPYRYQKSVVTLTSGQSRFLRRRIGKGKCNILLVFPYRPVCNNVLLIRKVVQMMCARATEREDNAESERRVTKRQRAEGLNAPDHQIRGTASEERRRLRGLMEETKGRYNCGVGRTT